MSNNIPDYSNPKSVSTLPYEFRGSSAVVCNGEVHILGSKENSSSLLRKSHYKWNGSTWESVSILPYDFWEGAAVVYYNDEIHILGGGNTAETMTKHYKWDGSVWTSVSELPYAFCDGCAVVYGNTIHILSGSDSSNSLSHYRWNGSTWTKEPDTLPHSIVLGHVLAYNDALYAIGGGSGTKMFMLNGSTWEEVCELPYNFKQGGAVVYDGKIHILGGEISSAQKKHYEWDGTSWESVSTLPYNLLDGSVVVHNEEIELLGGFGNTTKHYSISRMTDQLPSTDPVPNVSFRYLDVNGATRMVHNVKQITNDLQDQIEDIKPLTNEQKSALIALL